MYQADIAEESRQGQDNKATDVEWFELLPFTEAFISKMRYCVGVDAVVSKVKKRWSSMMWSNDALRHLTGRLLRDEAQHQPRGRSGYGQVLLQYSTAS